MMWLEILLILTELPFWCALWNTPFQSMAFLGNKKVKCLNC